MKLKKINNMRSKLFLFIFLIIILTIIPLGIYSTNNLNNTLYQEKEKKIKEMVEIGLGVLERFHKLEKSGELTKEEAQNQALSAIKNMIFGPDDKDYFWINNYEPKMLMHPYSTRLMGESVGNIQDEKGKYLFRDMVEVVEEKGSGFVEYHWKYYDEENRVEPKLSYVSGFEPWNWILGTGVYINDVQDSYNNLCNRFIMMGIVILALSLILTYFISNYFAKPIIYLTNKFDKISNYDLTMKKNDTFDKYKNRSDEIGEMMKALSKMQANISDMINKIGAKAEELETKKEELKVSNEQLTAYNEEIKAMNEELEQSFDEVNNLNKRFVEMVELVANMEDKTLLNEKEFFAGLLENAIKIVPEADYGKICIIDENNQFDFIDAV